MTWRQRSPLSAHRCAPSKISNSFDCRPRNGIAGAPISEHGRANALDMRSFKLANGVVIALNNAAVAKSMREKIRYSACARFSTVLGNGADGYHDTHVHIDLMERNNHYKICQWDVLDPAETAALAAKKAAAAAARIPAEMKVASEVPLPLPRPAADAVNLPQPGAPRIPREGAIRLATSADDGCRRADRDGGAVDYRYLLQG